MEGSDRRPSTLQCRARGVHCDAFNRHGLLPGSCATFERHRTERNAESIGDEPEQQVVRGAVDRWCREPDFERVAMSTTDLGAGRPGLDMELDTDTTGNCSDHTCQLLALGC